MAHLLMSPLITFDCGFGQLGARSGLEMGFDVIKEHGASTHLDGVNKTWLCLLGTACGGLLEPEGGVLHI